MGVRMPVRLAKCPRLENEMIERYSAQHGKIRAIHRCPASEFTSQPTGEIGSSVEDPWRN
jgi:hypothetical protein